jgi:hypothetical protein
MADQWTGKNLALTIEGDAVTCPQSFEVSGSHEFVEYYCVGTAGKQRVFDGTNWTASVTFFPEDNDHADLTDFNNTTAVAILAYPDGNTAGKTRVSFSAFSSVGLTTQRGSPGSSTVTFIIDGDVTFDAVPA